MVHEVQHSRCLTPQQMMPKVDMLSLPRQLSRCHLLEACSPHAERLCNQNGSVQKEDSRWSRLLRWMCCTRAHRIYCDVFKLSNTQYCLFEPCPGKHREPYLKGV